MKRESVSHRHAAGSAVIVFAAALVAFSLNMIWQHTAKPRQSNSTAAVTDVIADSRQMPDTLTRDGTQIPPPVIPTVQHDYVIPPVTDGAAPVLTHLPTKEPVVFLGIDDGAYKQAFELQLMKDRQVKASLFLADTFMQGRAGFFGPFVSAGSLIEDHTLSHGNLAKMSYDQQVAEICGQADKQQTLYGRRPTLFRPPGGDYNDDTPRAAAACGMKAVVLWIAKANGGSMQYQVGDKLQPGDIVLMHFRPEFKADMQAFLNAADAAGLHTELLETWLPQP